MSSLPLTFGNFFVHYNPLSSGRVSHRCPRPAGGGCEEPGGSESCDTHSVTVRVRDSLHTSYARRAPRGGCGGWWQRGYGGLQRRYSRYGRWTLHTPYASCAPLIPGVSSWRRRRRRRRWRSSRGVCRERWRGGCRGWWSGAAPAGGAAAGRERARHGAGAEGQGQGHTHGGCRPSECGTISVYE
jgi:hypothetical protein